MTETLEQAPYQSIRRKYDECLKRIGNVSTVYNVNKASSFNHIVNNLLLTPYTFIEHVDYRISSKKPLNISPDDVIETNKRLNLINRYLKLGEANPEFLEREVSSEYTLIRPGKKRGLDALPYIEFAERTLGTLQRKSELRRINNPAIYAQDHRSI